MTQEFLMDAMVKDLETLFEGYTLKNSAGVELPVRVYPQDLPIRAGSDMDADPEIEPTEGVDPEAPEPVPEPYVIVRLPAGEQAAQDERQTVEVILVVCVYDEAEDRQGFRDALHIVNAIMTHYGENSVMGRRYEVQYPIKWVTQQEDTHPYYFAGMALTVDAPAIFKEVPEA